MDTGQYGNSVRRPEYGGGTFRASNSLRAKFARGQDAVAMRSCDIAYHPAQGKAGLSDCARRPQYGAHTCKHTAGLEMYSDSIYCLCAASSTNHVPKIQQQKRLHKKAGANDDEDYYVKEAKLAHLGRRKPSMRTSKKSHGKLYGYHGALFRADDDDRSGSHYLPPALERKVAGATNATVIAANRYKPRWNRDTAVQYREAKDHWPGINKNYKPHESLLAPPIDLL